MKTTRSVVAGALCAWILLTAQALAGGAFSGNWTLMPADQPGKVQFSLAQRRERGHSQHSSEWPAETFQGVDLAERGKRDVQFTITRDAGRFDCEGYLNNGVGAGVFLFTPDARFTKALAGLGFTGMDEDKQFAMATVDVTVEFARQMQAEKLEGLDTDKLIALRIFDVTPQYIREMRAEGLPMTAVDRVIAFRVHGIEVAGVRAIKALGLHADENQLVAMRVHGVTPEYIDRLKARGVRDLSIDQLVSLRVHGIE